MNRIILIFILLLSTKVFGEENYLDRVRKESVAALAKKTSKAHASELVAVSVETKEVLVSSGNFASVSKVIFVDPQSETQRAPNQNPPLNIEARMAELQARTKEGISPVIYQYKAFIVVTGDREKVSEETYESFFQIKKQP